MIDFNQYKKIILIGPPGSGKSSLAKKIHQITNLPLIHLDNEFWKPNWVETPREDWIIRQHELIKKEKWIIDGNYCSTLEIRFSAADLIFYLDINPFVCIYSAAKRTGKKRSDLPDFLTEPKFFSKNFFSFAFYILKYRKYDKKLVFHLKDKYPSKKFIYINNRKQFKSLFI